MNHRAALRAELDHQRRRAQLPDVAQCSEQILGTAGNQKKLFFSADDQVETREDFSVRAG